MTFVIISLLRLKVNKKNSIILAILGKMVASLCSERTSVNFYTAIFFKQCERKYQMLDLRETYRVKAFTEESGNYLPYPHYSPQLSVLFVPSVK